MPGYNYGYIMGDRSGGRVKSSESGKILRNNTTYPMTSGQFKGVFRVDDRID